jgi:hypothetical protein
MRRYPIKKVRKGRAGLEDVCLTLMSEQQVSA